MLQVQCWVGQQVGGVYYVYFGWLLCVDCISYYFGDEVGIVGVCEQYVLVGIVEVVVKEGLQVVVGM